jgi:hypothetical protein
MGQRLELEPRLNVKYGFNWAGKNENFSKVSYILCNNKIYVSMLTWNVRFGIATGIIILIKPKLSIANSDRYIKKGN